ncbi:MAG: D-alanine--D-alanine ligase [Tepidibacter sp.]|uniref:D-alanine--D-alanine ligase n=1 Tax=Tepidibacter sp. TaxID=2529387 RepID=UPI0025CFCF3F|nr:D-alanine--D-alanine ligase [Tepidibacter sp.]MCT4508982.1 D-alanine--D-alanine ligase [Tepidibacter sp.]
MKKINVALIFGGKSGEHEVSLSSVSSIYKYINKEKYNVYTIGITKNGNWLYYEGDVEKIKDGSWEIEARKNVKINLIPTLNKEVGIEFDDNTFKKIDVLFPVLHGPYGEDGSIQGLFEISNIAYVGCNVLASSVGMDKLVCKKVFEQENIPQVKYTYTTRWEFNNNEEGELKSIESILLYPIFIKPANLGSSVGISKAKNKEELIKGIKEALEYDRRVVLEEGVNAKEIEVSVLGNEEIKASVAGEIIPAKEFYDYEAKYMNQSSKLIIPAKIEQNISEKIRNLAIKAFKAIDGCGLSRVDFFVEKETNNIYINEINTMPGFTNISMYPKLWENTGISYDKLIDELINLAIKRHDEKLAKRV